MRLLPLGYILGIVLFAACSNSPPGPAPAPSTTSAPTVAPSPAPATSEPSGSIERRPVLPAPLYVLDRGQIARIERDGVTRAQITRERIEIEGYLPISDFDAGPAGDLAYVVGDLDADRLSRTGPAGGEAQVLYSEPGHELSDITWAPDGEMIYLRLLNNKEPPDIPSGIYRIPAAGGDLEPVLADDPVDDRVNPSRALRGYRPFAFSPDGSHLLIEAFSLFYDGCDLATLPSAGGDQARITLPDGVEVYCGEASWAPDGASLLFLAGPPVGPDTGGPTIWRAPAAGGAAEAIAAPEALARAPLALPSDAARFFSVARPADPAGAAIFAPAEISGPGAAPQPLGEPFTDRLSLALWAPDGAGAVIVAEPSEEPLALRWLPIGGQPVELPHTRAGIRGLRWGVE